MAMHPLIQAMCSGGAAGYAEGGDVDDGASCPDDPAYEAAAKDLILALDRKDPEGVKMAFWMLFQCCDLQPHEEGPPDA